MSNNYLKIFYFTLWILFLSINAGAADYQDYQVEFLESAVTNELAERDPEASKQFSELAQQARTQGPIAIKDLPEDWQEKDVKQKGKGADYYKKLLMVELAIKKIHDFGVKFNPRLLAHAEVDTFHARHELFEDDEPSFSIIEMNEIDRLLIHAEKDLAGIVADKDKDGIVDYLDKCPDEPEDIDGFQDEDGCPDPDNDKDGILDVDDSCPDIPETFNGYKDKDGCPDKVPAQILLSGIHFDFDKWIIKKESGEILDDAAKILKQNPTLRILIKGHTDSEGSNKYNQKLSERRAGAVKEYLISRHQVSEDRLEVAGFGEEKPITSNDTPEGRTKNRRIEWLVLSGNEEGVIKIAK